MVGEGVLGARKGVSPRSLQPQPSQGVDDGVGASGVGKAVRGAKLHERARDPISSDDGHPHLVEKLTKHTKDPYLTRQLSLFFYHQLVILVDAR